MNSRVKNKINISSAKSSTDKPITNQRSKKITNEILDELNEDSNTYIKDSDVKVNLNNDDLRKIGQNEQMIEEEEIFKKFLIENDENKKEFLNEPTKEKESDDKVVSGWGPWASDTKVIQAKEFLKKKRTKRWKRKN